MIILVTIIVIRNFHTVTSQRVCRVKIWVDFLNWSEQKQQAYWKCTFILCQQVALSERQKYNCFPGNGSTQSSQHQTVQRSCLFNEIIAYWSLIVTLRYIAILVFPSPNLRLLEIIIKTFFYNLWLFMAFMALNLIQLNLIILRTRGNPVFQCKTVGSDLSFRLIGILKVHSH